MPHRQVNFASGSYYHLYNRGNDCQTIFLERENYLFFLRQFRRYLVEDTLDVLAYCLMPNHYHFLVKLRSPHLSARMQAFSLSYTKAINRRHGRCGSLFQGRFRAIEVNSDAYLLHLTRYIHLNPVKAKLVELPEDWEFSSYREYVNLRQGTLPKLETIRQEIGTANAYRVFVTAPDAPIQAKLHHLLFDE